MTPVDDPENQNPDSTANPVAVQRPSEEKRSGRGFRSMSPEKHREIAAMGGRTAHALGKAHRFTSEEARMAGKKGGRHDREHMARIAALGGAARPKNTAPEPLDSPERRSACPLDR